MLFSMGIEFQNVTDGDTPTELGHSFITNATLREQENQPVIMIASLYLKKGFMHPSLSSAINKWQAFLKELK